MWTWRTRNNRPPTAGCLVRGAHSRREPQTRGIGGGLDREGGFGIVNCGNETKMTDTVWMYEQFRAGEVYNKFMFDSREEAESFAAQMARAEPDLVSKIAPIEARTVWN